MSSSSVSSAAGTSREKKCGGQVGKEAWRQGGMEACVRCVLNPLVDGQANAVSTGSRQKLRYEIFEYVEHPAPSKNYGTISGYP